MLLLKKRSLKERVIRSQENKEYFILQTAENKEFSVRSELVSTYKNVDIFIPVIKSSIYCKDKKYIYYDRVTPSYVMVNFDDCQLRPSECMDNAKNIINVTGRLSESIGGGNKYCTVKLGDFKSDYNIRSTSSLFEKGDNVIILHGQYASFLAKITHKPDDLVRLKVMIKGRPEVVLPIWSICKEEENA